MEKRGNSYLIGIFLILSAVFFSSFTYAVGPSGANVTMINSTTSPSAAPQSVPAQAGNVTELNVFGYSTTQTWQGYFGNVTGAILLSDSNRDVMYNWSLASPKGEIYASTNNSIQWSYVQCFNFSAAGTYAADTANAGQTSKFGTNLTQLESQYGISLTDVDGVDETFVYSGPVSGHQNFYTSSLQFNSGQCRSTRVFDSTGTGVKNNFEEALLYEPQSTSVIFASLLNQDAFGFNNRTHDFEMLVLEDGHGTNVATTPYYFYVELQ